jgi:hypothetical protein
MIEDSPPITEPEQASPEWLTHILRRTVFWGFDEVASVEIALTKTLPVHVLPD